MTNYVLIYRGGAQPEGEEQQKAVMDAWMGWFGSLGDAVVDAGNPFGTGRSIAPDGSVSEGGSGITGYSIISAESLDAATESARECPQLAAGGTVEVYETFLVM